MESFSFSFAFKKEIQLLTKNLNCQQLLLVEKGFAA
jgi:hypothetical protein